jgi:hypothetical protein
MALVANIPNRDINSVSVKFNCDVDSDNECPICFHDMLFPKQVSCCNKHFHVDCLNKWYAKSPTCPNCRAQKNKVFDKKYPYFMLQLFYNRYNRENGNTIVPKTVGIDNEIDVICNKYALCKRIEFDEKYKSQMIRELSSLTIRRSFQQAILEQANNLTHVNDPPKKRGRPLGSKNKTKEQKEIEALNKKKHEEEVKIRKNQIKDMLIEFNINNINNKRQEQQDKLNEELAKKETERVAKGRAS